MHTCTAGTNSSHTCTPPHSKLTTYTTPLQPSRAAPAVSPYQYTTTPVSSPQVQQGFRQAPLPLSLVPRSMPCESRFVCIYVYVYVYVYVHVYV